MNYKDLKANGYFGIDFYLTKSCNKSCHYCTAWTLEMRNLEVDMDFLSKTLKYLSRYKAKINLLGGEPGLVKNLDEVIAEIKKYPTLIPSVLSNSFVRKRYPHILEDPSIYYVEHLVLDFHEDRIEKLGNFDFLEKNDNNNYNVVIMTPNYFKFKENYDLSYIEHDNTIFKKFNARSPFYDVDMQASEITRKLCAKYPSVPVIDFEIQKIRHCSKKVINGSRTFDVTKKNIEKMMNFDLFQYEEYCKACTEQLNPLGEYTLDNLIVSLNDKAIYR